MSIEMVSRLTATHELETGYHWVEIPTDIGWVGCMLCSMPFKPGGKLLYDNVSHKGVCEDCGERGLDELLGKRQRFEDEMALPF